MKTWVLLLGCSVALAGMAHAAEPHREIWVWTDANGVKHYSDSPAPGARRIEIAGQPNIGTVAPAASPAAGARPATAEKPSAVEYSVLEVYAPENNASFFEPDVIVDVRLRSDPDLATGDKLVTYFDGKPVEGGENSYSHSFTNLERGGHTVVGVIYDAQGKEKIRSEPLIFWMKLPTEANPRNVGPSLRPPPPKPQPKPGTGRPGG
jgi:hypothetical protein